MRCAFCMYDNPPDYLYCGSCGQARAQSDLANRPAETSRMAWPGGQPVSTAPRSSPPQSSPPQSSPPRSLQAADAVPMQARAPEAMRPRRGARPQEMTRYLCAAVTINKALGETLLEHVLDEEHRAVAVTPGLDLVTVLKYTIAAHRRRLIRDVLLLVLLLFMLLCIFKINALLVIPLLALAWLAVFIEQYVSFFGRASRGLRPGAFDPAAAPQPTAGSEAARQLDRVAAAAKEGNLTLYSAFPPFLGYGKIETNWSLAVDVTRPRRDSVPRAFSVLDLFDYLKRDVAALDLPQLEMSERVFVSGHEIGDDRRFLPDPAGGPATSIPGALVRQLIADPEESARPYLTLSVTGWQGDIVITTLVRLVLTRTDLFVEVAHTVVPPLRPAFRVIDELGQAPTAGEFFSIVGGSLRGTFPRLLGSVPALAHAMGAAGRREKKTRRVLETGDYGALISVREVAADSKWQRYFQKIDDAHYARVVELRIVRSLTEYLKSHNIDTSSLERQSENVISAGVLISNSTVVGSQIAGGQNAQATGMFSRLRGESGGETGGSTHE